MNNFNTFGGRNITAINRDNYQRKMRVGFEDTDHVKKITAYEKELLKLLIKGSVSLNEWVDHLRSICLPQKKLLAVSRSLPFEIAAYDEGGYVDCLNRERIKPILEKLGAEK
jgi:hypothetical protein